ncbi:LuxR C-terminal-related transcriptional regulator [Wenyingzhuangia sp. IMCC45533]
MKPRLFLTFFLLCYALAFSQISYFYDASGLLNVNDIQKQTFKSYQEPINKGLIKGNYWFLIKTDEPKKICFKNRHIHQASIFSSSGEKQITNKKHQRFVTFLLPAYSNSLIKVKLYKEAYIPVQLSESNYFNYTEQNNLLFIGFYFGFVMVIIIINLFYYFSFKEDTFLYYTSFLFFISLGLFISDGLFNFWHIDGVWIDRLQAIDHVLVAITGVYFAENYLQAKNYFKNSIRYSWLLLIVLLVVNGLYLWSLDFKYYVILEILVFGILILWWTIGVLLYSKNIFTKFFVWAYVFILILGINYYVLKLLGLKFLGITAIHVKLGGLIEMLFLSYSVVYRMKTLQNDNKKMRFAIVKHLNEIKTLSNELSKLANNENNIFTQYDLSPREKEILQLIAAGKTNKEISEETYISVNTVKFHVKKIYQKLEISNRKEIYDKINLL